MDEAKAHTHIFLALETTSAVIAGLNTDNRPDYTKLASAIVVEQLPGNAPIRALTVNCWLVQWLEQSFYTESLLAVTVNTYVHFM